ncbi:MAG: secD [Pseudonocardiales bacterium]|nr:secD [Pseudonocardiales bacterium]
MLARQPTYIAVRVGAYAAAAAIAVAGCSSTSAGSGHRAAGSSTPATAAASGSGSQSTAPVPGPSGGSATPSLSLSNTPTGALELRGLVMPGIPTGAANGAPTGDPLAGLTFPVPTSEATFDKLPVTQQQQLSAALATAQCGGNLPATVTYRVVCDYSLGAHVAALLGPVIVAGDQVQAAAAVAPDASAGQTQWTVLLTLKSTGSTAWAQYTAAHNAGNIPAAGGYTQCSQNTTPCADYVAFVVGTTVVSVPLNQSAINGGTTQIAGNFTEQSATALAQMLNR